MANPDSNKAGNPKTTSKEYVKRESGGQDMPHVPAENDGNTSPNPDDLENPEQKSGKPHPKDESIGEKIEETND